MRAVPIDLLRGFIMILMAVDHASGMISRVHFTEAWGISFQDYPSLGWWFTRFVSHLCAPGFFFLMGMSIYLFAQKRRTQNWESKDIRNYFIKRGSLILGIMLFLEFPAWGLSNLFAGNLDPQAFVPLPGHIEGALSVPTTVLYGLGMVMIISSFLWGLKKEWLLMISIASFGFSGWYISQLDSSDTFHSLETLIHIPAFAVGLSTMYPILPWLGVTTFGIFCAKILEDKKEGFYRMVMYLGLLFIALFFLFRFLEFGNFQRNAFEDWISFFTLIKYPPSLTFILITMGLNFIFLFAFFKLSKVNWLAPVKLFGQTAMFFYIAHLYLYALIGAIFPEGCSIEVMYVCWLVGLIILYFLCRWFLEFKRGKPANSIWKMI